MVKIACTKTFPATRKQGFAFFMDVARWAEWTPFTVEDLDTARFTDEGDELRVVYRRLGIPMHGTIVLEEVVDGETLAVKLMAPGMPPVSERFVLHDSGSRAFLLEATMEIEDHGWVGKTLRRMSLLPMIIRRDLCTSLDKAHAIFAGKVIEKTRSQAA